MLAANAHALVGDVNGDGKVTVDDARLVANFLVGNSTALPHPENADVNNDGKITTADALLILQFAKGLRTSFGFQVPQVLAVAPADGASGVLVSAGVSVFFSAPASNASLTGGVTVTDTFTNQLVAGTFQGSQGGVIQTFSPAQPLAPNRNYRVSVTTAVTNTDGTHLGQPFASSFQTQALGSLILLSVNNSSAPLNSVVPQPIKVQALDSGGAPVKQVPVVFTAQMGPGTFQPSGLRQITVLTDANGTAQATLQLGGQAISNTVVITAAGFAPAPVFSVLTLPAQATLLRIYSGNNQAGALGSTPPLPLVVQAMDPGGNSIQGTTVTFRITQGQGSFNGQPTGTAVTDSSGTASTPFTFGASPGPVLVQTSFSGMIGEAPVMNMTAIAPQPSSPTAVVGSVIDGITLAPLPGVIVYLAENEAISTTTDQGGRFRLLVSSGPHIVVVAGIDSGVINGHTYPEVSYPVNAVQGQDTDLGIPSMLPELDPDSCIDVSDVQGGTLTIKSHPLWKLFLAPGQAHFSDGTRTGHICAQFVRHDRIPMPVAGGKTSLFEDTVQPPDVKFDPPAPVTFPNDDNLKPGTVTEIFTLDYVTGVFKKTGRGLVSEDGTVLNSLPGQGITQGGWHLAPSPVPPPVFCIKSLLNLGNRVIAATLSAFGISAGGIQDAQGLWRFLLCGLPANQGPVNPLVNVTLPGVPSTPPTTPPGSGNPTPPYSGSPSNPAPPLPPPPNPLPTVTGINLKIDPPEATEGDEVTFTATVQLDDPSASTDGIIINFSDIPPGVLDFSGTQVAGAADAQVAILAGQAILKGRVLDLGQDTIITMTAKPSPKNIDVTVPLSVAVAAALSTKRCKFEIDASAIIRSIIADPLSGVYFGAGNIPPVSQDIFNFLDEQRGRVCLSRTTQDEVLTNPSPGTVADISAYIVRKKIGLNWTNGGLHPNLYSAVFSQLRSASNPTGGPFSTTDAGVAASAIAHNRRLLFYGETKFRDQSDPDPTRRGIAGLQITSDPTSILRVVQWGDAGSGDTPNIIRRYTPPPGPGD